ncbi:hypothetical protein KOAAANKH_00472 [Brevundimonas sp. NIBR10]|uniref:hypothetical protein n=1 Tax=Brevundimonas sp. NIBR10 TaxID=3015997 RepID=UPI0022F15B4C|nr:hypothetical protein [Brevundimonas sp. NIBR10]WGM45609.1 hypothetical protein KOAAANKH_00472 [Brevundimonas sp. NIBR10]
MGKMERVVAELPKDVFADIEEAVSAGEFSSVQDAVTTLATEWSTNRRADSPEFRAHALAMIEESRRDSHPGYPMEEVFAELRARYADPVSIKE